MIYDISPVLDSKLGVWPGDTPLRRDVLLDIAAGHNITLSTLHTTVHVGAHADAPSHYGRDGDTIDERSLEFYLGDCDICSVAVKPGERIEARHFTSSPLTVRVLLKTNTFLDYQNFPTDFAACAPELIDFLASRGVITIGIDTPSVDLFDSAELPAHQAVLRNNMAILEGLMLRDVPDGIYELIALPLRLAGFDASPVRAILRKK